MLIIDNNNIQVYKLEIDVENTGHITNTYIIKDMETSKMCIIDPAFDEEKIKDTIDKIGGNLELVIVTHCHADHISALANLVNENDVKVYVHTLDYDGLYDNNINQEEIVGTKVLPADNEKVIKVEDKEEIKFGKTKLEVIHTPGHTKGSICILDKDNNLLYSGDTLFEKTYGRTDLITGSHSDMKQTLDKLFNRFEDIQVFPGHGNGFNISGSKRVIRLLFAYKG